MDDEADKECTAHREMRNAYKILVLSIKIKRPLEGRSKLENKVDVKKTRRAVDSSVSA